LSLHLQTMCLNNTNLGVDSKLQSQLSVVHNFDMLNFESCQMTIMTKTNLNTGSFQIRTMKQDTTIYLK